MRIAVVGGGLFGCTSAIHLARAGHKIELYEKSDRILGAASGINQLRLHEGFHYPRAPETVAECRAGLASFRKEYGSALIDGGGHFYGIAAEGSRVSGADYLAFCARHGLTYQSCIPFTSALEVLIQVEESRIDPVALSAIVMRELVASGVVVHLETRASYRLREDFDQVVIAAYAGSNDAALELGAEVTPFQFEVVEKPVLRLPAQYHDFSLVVMDGPFCSLDPYGETGLHLMGHVAHAIHASNVGLEPEVPEHLRRYLDKGIIERPEQSRFERFVEAGRAFIPFLDKAEHVGSMWTVRAVLPDMDESDARPTLVQRLDERVIRVFSGKLGCACQAATRVLQMLESSRDKTGDRGKLVA